MVHGGGLEEREAAQALKGCMDYRKGVAARGNEADVEPPPVEKSAFLTSSATIFTRALSGKGRS